MHCYHYIKEVLLTGRSELLNVINVLTGIAKAFSSMSITPIFVNDINELTGSASPPKGGEGAFGAPLPIVVGGMFRRSEDRLVSEAGDFSDSTNHRS